MAEELLVVKFYNALIALLLIKIALYIQNGLFKQLIIISDNLFVSKYELVKL